MMKALQTSARTGASTVSRTALRKSLLTAEIGITVVLLVAAGLLLKSFLRLRSADVGCVTEKMLTLQYSLPEKKYQFEAMFGLLLPNIPLPDPGNAFHSLKQCFIKCVHLLRGVVPEEHAEDILEVVDYRAAHYFVQPQAGLNAKIYSGKSR